MLISKERAEYLASLSYKYCKNNNKMDQLLTYQMAMELDKYTGEDIIRDLEDKLMVIDMDSSLRELGYSSHYFVDEILVIDNYQYVDFYEYEYNGTIPSSLTVKMHE